MPEIGPMKANELGRGTRGTLDNAPSSSMRDSACECFLEVN